MDLMRIFKQYLIVFVLICSVFVVWTLIDTTTEGFETDPLSEAVDPRVWNPNMIRAPLTPTKPVCTLEEYYTRSR